MSKTHKSKKYNRLRHDKDAEKRFNELRDERYGRRFGVTNKFLRDVKKGV